MTNESSNEKTVPAESIESYGACFCEALESGRARRSWRQSLEAPGLPRRPRPTRAHGSIAEGSFEAGDGSTVAAEVGVG